ncbi:MAG: glycosyltransferase family 4 protein [Limisphaerales bacterium]
MKLLIVSPSQGHFGGMEGFVIGLASAIEAWPECELQVCFKLVGKRDLENDLRRMASSLDCPVHFVRSGDFKLLRLIYWADIVHGQNTSPDIIFPAWVLGKKLVLTIHNWRRRGMKIHPMLWGAGVRLAHRRWYNSQFVWNTWEPGRKSKSSDCVPTVHNDVVITSSLPDRWCAPAERKGFLFLGRWIENKGIEDLVIAYSQARLDPVEWPLILIGDGPLRQKVERLITNLKVTGVEMPGFVDNQSKAKRLASSRWLVAPSNTREDMGVTPIEARSVGVPVIVTRDGGLPEAGGEDALIVEPGNIEELTGALRLAASMRDDEYYERSARGYKTLKDYLRPMEFYRKSYAAIVNEI